MEDKAKEESSADDQRREEDDESQRPTETGSAEALDDWIAMPKKGILKNRRWSESGYRHEDAGYSHLRALPDITTLCMFITALYRPSNSEANRHAKFDEENI